MRDEAWSMHEIVATLCNRRYTEKCIGYAAGAHTRLLFSSS